MAKQQLKRRPLNALLNLGSVTATRLQEVGIADEAALRRSGAFVSYRRVKHAFPRETTIVLLYALVGALTDTPWTELSPKVRTDLRRQAGG